MNKKGMKMNTMKHVVMALLIIMISLCHSAQAKDISPMGVDHNWYYQIGGGDLITAPANTNPAAISLGASAMWGANMSCGNFDFNLSIKGFMDDLRDGADRAVSQMVMAAKGFVSSLPALIFQRVNPGLYDLFQNGLLRAEELFNISIKTCEQMETDFAAGGNPFDKFVVLSRKNEWKKQIKDGGDVIHAKRKVEKKGGDDGLPGLGGKSYAGKGQPALNVTEQTAQAGYNSLIGRSVSKKGSAPAKSGRIAEIWKSPAQLQQYAVDVLGSSEIRTCEGCEKARTSMGKGLLPQLYKEHQSIATELSSIMSSPSAPTYSELDAVSASGLRITPTVIQALKNEPAGERQLLMSRLASDIATANVLEKAELLLQALETGKHEPNLASNDMVTYYNDKNISALNRYINNILLSARIKKTISTDSVKIILAREQTRTKYVSGSGQGTVQEKDMQGGAPKK